MLYFLDMHLERMDCQCIFQQCMLQKPPSILSAQIYACSAWVPALADVYLHSISVHALPPPVAQHEAICVDFYLCKSLGSSSPCSCPPLQLFSGQRLCCTLTNVLPRLELIDPSSQSSYYQSSICAAQTSMFTIRLNPLSGSAGTHTEPSKQKSGFHLPRLPMANPDLARLINSDEIQSVVNPPKSGPVRRPRLRRNPLNNLGAPAQAQPLRQDRPQNGDCCSRKPQFPKFWY